MFKRLVSFFLTITLVVSLSSMAFAIDTSDKTLNYLLTCDGLHAQTVPTGTEITVEYAVENTTNDDDFSVYTLQSEIYYDYNFFEFVEGSFVKTDKFSAVEGNAEGEGHKLIKKIKVTSVETQQFQNHQVICSFKLKVIAASGSSTIKSLRDGIITYENGNTKYGIYDQLGNLTITVGNAPITPTFYTISYNANGVTTTEQAAEGETIMLPAAPGNAPANKVFDCWKASDGTSYNPGDSYTVTKNVTFTAIFKDAPKPNYTLSFETNGGNQIASVSKEEGEVVSLSAYVPQRSGYTFAGWYREAECRNKVTEVTLNSNITVYAKWNANGGGSVTVKNYTLKFDTDGGSQINDIKRISGTKISLDKYVTKKTGYDFAGWYSDKELTKKVNEITLTADTTVYAKWVKSGEIEPTKPPTFYIPEMLTDKHIAYIVGREGNRIEPQANITRAEVATIIYRLLKDDVRNQNYTKENNFTDVAEDDWYNTAVSTLVNAGVINGRTGTEFAPNEFITRAEYATMAARMATVNGTMETVFDDIDEHWAYDYIKKAVSLGWIVGDNGKFRPDDNITRAEAMTLTNRMLVRQPESISDILSDKMTKFDDNADTSAWYYLAVQEATNSHDYEIKADGRHEKWTEIMENPDWSNLEK